MKHLRDVQFCKKKISFLTPNQLRIQYTLHHVTQITNQNKIQNFQ